MFNLKSPQNNLKLYLAALSTGAALVLSAATNAGQAQNSVRYTSGQLEQVHFHKTPLKLQIINENPTVTNCMPVEEPPKTYQINVPGRPSGGAAPGVIQLNAAPPALPSTGFSSNIPAGGTGVIRNLPGVEQGQLGKQMAAEAKAMKSTAVRQIGKPGSKPTALQASTPSTPTAPAAYSSYRTSGGSAGSITKTTTDATGKIQKRDLLLK